MLVIFIWTYYVLSRITSTWTFSQYYKLSSFKTNYNSLNMKSTDFFEKTGINYSQKKKKEKQPYKFTSVKFVNVKFK